MCRTLCRVEAYFRVQVWVKGFDDEGWVCVGQAFWGDLDDWF